MKQWVHSAINISAIIAVGATLLFFFLSENRKLEKEIQKLNYLTNKLSSLDKAGIAEAAKALTDLKTAVVGQNSLIHDALGEYIPIKLGEDIEKNLNNLDKIISDKDSWPKTKSDAEQKITELENLKREIPTYAEDEYFPKINRMLWALEMIGMIREADIAEEQDLEKLKDDLELRLLERLDDVNIYEVVIREGEKKISSLTDKLNKFQCKQAEIQVQECISKTKNCQDTLQWIETLNCENTPEMIANLQKAIISQELEKVKEYHENAVKLNPEYLKLRALQNIYNYALEFYFSYIYEADMASNEELLSLKEEIGKLYDEIKCMEKQEAEKNEKETMSEEIVNIKELHKRLSDLDIDYLKLYGLQILYDRAANLFFNYENELSTEEQEDIKNEISYLHENIESQRITESQNDEKAYWKYQEWALKQIKAFDKEINKSVLDKIREDEKFVCDKMLEYLSPIDTRFLDQVVLDRYSRVYQIGIEKIADDSKILLKFYEESIKTKKMTPKDFIGDEK